MPLPLKESLGGRFLLAGGSVGVDLGRGQVFMAKDVLESGERGPAIDNLRGEGVTKHMRRDLVGHADLLPELLDHGLYAPRPEEAVISRGEERCLGLGAEAQAPIELE